MDNNSAKKAKDEIALRRILRELHGINCPRPSASLKDQVINKNFLNGVKSTDASQRNNYLSATTENKFGKEAEKTEEHETPPRVSSHKEFSRRKYKLDVELEKLRKTVNSCHNSIEPLQQHVDMRLKYYNALSRSNYLEVTTTSLVSRKRKVYQDDSDRVDTDGEDSDDYDTGSWSSELDGLKIIFRRIKEEDH